jgi:hypothetical protein
MKDPPTHTLVFQGWDAVMELHMAATQGYGIFLPLNCSLNLLTYNYFNVHTSVNKVALFLSNEVPVPEPFTHETRIIKILLLS